MKYVLTANQMKSAETATIEYFGVPSCVLMEKAAQSVVDVILEKNLDTSKTLVLCGTGNNGGDGFAVARMLLQKGVLTTVLFVGKKEKCSVECTRQMLIYQNYLRVFPNGKFLDEDTFSGNQDLEGFTLVIDALFGIGLSRPLSENYGALFDSVKAASPKAATLAVDIPSGIDTNTGAVLGAVFSADYTVTFGFKKRGQMFYPGRDYCGQTIVTEIGIDEASLRKGLIDEKPEDVCSVTFETEDFKLLPKRDPASNKGSYGKALIIAGACNMAGAAVFSSLSCYRTGAGLVTVYTDERNREIIQKSVPEAVLKTFAYSDTFNDADLLKQQLEQASVICCGPGLGIDDTTVERLLFVLQNANKPLVLDADALNIVSFRPEVAQALQNYPNEVIVTPHLGEASRMIRGSISEIKLDPIRHANMISEMYHVTCVLKDAVTVVCDPKGRSYINQNGNHGMSTGGSGDVLAGIITGLLAQHANSYDAARLGVFMHAAAGDLAALRYSPQSTTASNISESIGEVYKYLEQ